jgi:hypothetical protein
MHAGMHALALFAPRRDTAALMMNHAAGGEHHVLRVRSRLVVVFPEAYVVAGAGTVPARRARRTWRTAARQTPRRGRRGQGRPPDRAAPATYATENDRAPAAGVNAN